MDTAMDIRKPYMDLYVLIFTEIMLKKAFILPPPPPQKKKIVKKHFIFLGSR